jgi:hypothetical protein
VSDGGYLGFLPSGHFCATPLEQWQLAVLTGRAVERVGLLICGTVGGVARGAAEITSNAMEAVMKGRQCRLRFGPRAFHRLEYEAKL